MAHPARSTYGSFPPHSARNGSNSGTRAKGPTFFKSGTFTFGRIPAVPLSVVERPLFAPTQPTLFASLMGSRGSGETRKSSAAGKDRTLSAYDGFAALLIDPARTQILELPRGRSNLALGDPEVHFAKA